MVVSGNLVLRIDGSDYVVADVSRAPLLDNRGLGGPPLSPVPGMVVNPAFVRWRQRAIAWQQERLNRQLQFLAACTTIRLDSLIGHEADIELDRTVEFAADKPAEPVDDEAIPLGITGSAAPAM